jgi:carbamate kinase
VVLDYGGENQRELATVSVSEMEAFDEQGQFGTGSMKPKVEAAIGFVRRTGKPATITSLQHAAEGLAGEVGTHVVA